MSHSNLPFSVCITASKDGREIRVQDTPEAMAVAAARKLAARQEILFCLAGQGLTQPQVTELCEIARAHALTVAINGHFVLSRALQRWAPQQRLFIRHPVREMGYGEITPPPSWMP